MSESKKYEFIEYHDLPETEPYLRERGPAPFPVRVIAAKMWSEEINTPGNNGDPFHGALNAMLADAASKDYGDTQRTAVARSIVLNGGKALRAPSWRGDATYTQGIDDLSVDYGPCASLAALVDAAGVDGRIAWPMKCSSRLDQTCFTFSFGYRAPHLHVYPLEDGRVLVSEQRFAVPGLLAWCVERATDALPPGCEWADWNWKEYATSLGFDS